MALLFTCNKKLPWLAEMIYQYYALHLNSAIFVSITLHITYTELSYQNVRSCEIYFNDKVTQDNLVLTGQTSLLRRALKPMYILKVITPYAEIRTGHAILNILSGFCH